MPLDTLKFDFHTLYLANQKFCFVLVDPVFNQLKESIKIKLLLNKQVLFVTKQIHDALVIVKRIFDH